MRPSSLALIASILVLLPLGAWAQNPEQGDDFTPIYEEQLLGFDDLSLDTGWIPAGSPVQMRFLASATNTVGAVLPGDAWYDWRDHELRFVGDSDSGFFSYDVGLELHAEVKVDVPLITWQSDLLGPYDFAIDEVDWFTPYLLPGNLDRPAAIANQTEGLTIASVPILPDIIILSGNLDIDIAVDVSASLACERIEVEGPLGQVVFVGEGEELVVEPGEGNPGEDLELEARLVCHLVTMPSLIVRPHLVMQVGLDEYDIAGIDIPIDLPIVDEEVAFDPITLSFPRPEDASETGEGGGEGESDSGSGVGDDEVGDNGSESNTDGGGLDVDEGCNCSTGAAPHSAASALMLVLGLFRLRRRAN